VTAVAERRPTPAVQDAACRSMAGTVEVVSVGDAAGAAPHAVTTLHVSATELVFDGHYPGFPILPGVCLIEIAHRSARLTAEAAGLPAGLRLAAVESARFLDPVYPDETVTVELAWRPAAGGWQARTVLRTDRAESARVRLRYDPPGSP
jgi:3-hydroxyacyl-[acyl-carrier-protein] dehydratase